MLVPFNLQTVGCFVLRFEPFDVLSSGSFKNNRVISFKIASKASPHRTESGLVTCRSSSAASQRRFASICTQGSERFARATTTRRFARIGAQCAERFAQARRGSMGYAKLCYRLPCIGGGSTVVDWLLRYTRALLSRGVDLSP